MSVRLPPYFEFKDCNIEPMMNKTIKITDIPSPAPLATVPIKARFLPVCHSSSLFLIFDKTLIT
jgi:hypothetical protein